MRSIMTDNLKVCYFCGKTENIDLHHCIHGKIGRKLATQYHLLVGLCQECHRGACGVHGKYGYEKDLKLKRDAQLAWEARRVKKGKSEPETVRDDWVKVFGVDYVVELQDFVDECKRDFVTEEDEEKILEEIYKEIKGVRCYEKLR